MRDTPRSDFSNGFLVAEVFSRYYPADVALHSYDPAATNAARKKDNWELLLKFCKARVTSAWLDAARRAHAAR